MTEQDIVKFALIIYRVDGSLNVQWFEDRASAMHRMHRIKGVFENVRSMYVTEAHVAMRRPMK